MGRLILNERGQRLIKLYNQFDELIAEFLLSSSNLKYNSNFRSAKFLTAIIAKNLSLEEEIQTYLKEKFEATNHIINSLIKEFFQ